MHAHPSELLRLSHEQNISTNTTRKSRGERLRLYILLQVRKKALLPERHAQPYLFSSSHKPLQDNL